MNNVMQSTMFGKVWKVGDPAQIGSLVGEISGFPYVGKVRVMFEGEDGAYERVCGMFDLQEVGGNLKDGVDRLLESEDDEEPPYPSIGMESEDEGEDEPELKPNPRRDDWGNQAEVVDAEDEDSTDGLYALYQDAIGELGELRAEHADISGLYKLAMEAVAKERAAGAQIVEENNRLVAELARLKQEPPSPMNGEGEQKGRKQEPHPPTPSPKHGEGEQKGRKQIETVTLIQNALDMDDVLAAADAKLQELLNAGWVVVSEIAHMVIDNLADFPQLQHCRIVRLERVVAAAPEDGGRVKIGAIVVAKNAGAHPLTMRIYQKGAAAFIAEQNTTIAEAMRKAYEGRMAQYPIRAFTMIPGRGNVS